MKSKCFLIVVLLNLIGCSDGTSERVEKERAEIEARQKEEDRRISELRESETLIAFGGIRFGDTEEEVNKKLATTPNLTKEYSSWYFGSPKKLAYISPEYHNGGLYKVLFEGEVDNLKLIEGLIIEKYKLSESWRKWKSSEFEFDGEDYTVQYIVHTVGSRKEIEFSHTEFRRETDKNRQRTPRVPSYIIIYDSKTKGEIDAANKKIKEEGGRIELENARKVF